VAARRRGIDRRLQRIRGVSLTVTDPAAATGHA